MKLTNTFAHLQPIATVSKKEIVRRKPQHRESELQRACVKWFDLQYPKYRQLLFAIPNGGARNAREAAIMKGDGVRAGVADMFFAYRSGEVIYKALRTDCGGLFIEFKIEKNNQTKEQRMFAISVMAGGYFYVVVRNFEQFKRLIEQYLPNSKVVPIF